MNGIVGTFSRIGATIATAGLMFSCWVGCGGSETEIQTPPPSSTENTYILIHGAFADVSGWDRVVPLLKDGGDEVIALEVPAHGVDTTPVAGATLQAYTDTVVKAIDSAAHPVILVGHSLGGVIVSQAAELRPNKVAKIVYLAAFLLNDGLAALDGTKGDQESKLGAYLLPSSDQSSFSLKDGWVEGFFCQDCSAEDAAALREHFKPEPAAPFTAPIHVTQENWGRIPRVYIQADKDLAIGPATQESFYKKIPCEKVIHLDSGHCPFLTKPAELADALKSL